VFQFTKLSGASGGGSSSTSYISFQIVLWGNTSSNPGRIDIIYGTSAGTPGENGVIGIIDAAGTFINGTNGSTSSTATASSWPTSGQIYTFAKPTPSTFSWSPATFLSSTSIANPVATAVTALYSNSFARRLFSYRKCNSNSFFRRSDCYSACFGYTMRRTKCNI
jgi:hypothetical protein